MNVRPVDRPQQRVVRVYDALACAGATFADGRLVERPDDSGGDQQAA